MEPFTMMALMAGGQALGGLLQKGQSALMRRRARREFQPYEIPSSAKAMLDKATSVASLRGVPGEDIYRSQAQASVARGTEAAQRTAESPSDVLSVLSRLYGDYQGFEQNLAVQGEQSYERRQSQLMNALNRFSQFERERWQYNELYPYMQAMGEAGQMDMAGNQNIQSAVSTGMNIYGAQTDMDFQREQFANWQDAMFGKNTGAQWGRSRAQEYGVRNLSESYIPPTTLNVPRTSRPVTPINPYMLPDVNVYGTYQ